MFGHFDIRFRCFFLQPLANGLTVFTDPIDVILYLFQTTSPS